MKWLVEIGTWIKSHLMVSVVICLIIVGVAVSIPSIINNVEEIKTNIELIDDLNFEINSEVYSISLIKKISNGELITENFKIDTSSLGTQEVIIKYLNEKQEEQEYKFNINVIDTTAPTIEFNEELSTTVGTEIDLLNGVVAKDNSNEEIIVTVNGDYDFNKSGVYNLKYVASDSSGNKTEEDFILKVNNVTIKTNGYYVYKGAKVWYQISFGSDYSFILQPWYCPGAACGGGGTERGTYKINGNIINVNIPAHYTDGDPMIDIIEYIDEQNWKITIVSSNQISLNGYTYTWQSKEMYY